MAVVHEQPLVHRLARRWTLSGWRGGATFWRLADRLAHWPADGVVRMWPGVIVPAVPHDYVPAAFYRGTYERAELRLLSALLRDPEPRLVVDVGANVGVYTALFSSLTGPSGRVLAFEPAPETFAILRAAIEIAPLANVTAMPVAVGRAAGSASLYDLGGATNTGLASLREPEQTPAGVQVPVVALDELDELAGRDVDLIKIDVEGLEGEVLAGAAGLFRSRRVSFALIEISPHFGAAVPVAEFLSEIEGSYAFISVHERGRLRRRPVLERVSSRAVADADHQFNLLVSRMDLVDRVPRWFGEGAR